jgi:hypothetical protein
MTDTAYLYQYFLQHSPEKKGSTSKDVKKNRAKTTKTEVNRDGKHSK